MSGPDSGQTSAGGEAAAGKHAERLRSTDAVQRASGAAPWRMACAGLIAALVAWAVVATWYPFFKSGLSFGPGAVPTAEESALLFRVRWQNSAVVFASAGSLMGALLGLMAGFRRRAAIACFSGAVFGAVFGALASWCVLGLADQPFDAIVDPTENHAEMVKWTIIHAIAWTITGFGVGLGCSLPWASWSEMGRKTAGAMLGGLIAGPCFHVLISLIELVKPMGGTEMLVPDRHFMQLVWLASAGVLIGLLAGSLGVKAPKKPKPTTAASASPRG